MKRNPLLRSILLTCVCLLAISSFHQALAQQPTTEGQLLAVDAKGQAAGPCPLKHTNVKAEISGFIARVTVTQQFQNPFPDKIEAIYTFPLPQAAAVDDMTIMIGERTVKGKIMRREEAQATYDAAKARGQTAALLNQQRPNIFTQAVANILPNQQINVTISYVETLKYDEGSYEWHFPMVVGERYIPGPKSSDEPTENQADSQEPKTAETPRVPDAELITPPVANGMRAGHDISIEVNIDAGVPLVGFHSLTHEIEAVQPAAGRAIVRLKDQATIPNKDFVLKYDVAGAQIEDALLFHRANNEGYFTFILQPPQRVTVEDVTPKELVFVLDTSGSMGGFPIEKAKETMLLALNGLYPRDTFNVILFSGDTKILFSEPQPATPDNINKAKKLVASANGNGGTEMMKAIRAALAPSDASDHVRITCFMTDGQVGDDMEIIAEVQKHPNARVFAMGFGAAPNRFLLDKITEYGRGEVEYVTENGDAKRAAKRFHERIRNPLLTDVSIDWNGLPVTDVYPKSLPDLFSAKPVMFYGRYVDAAKGVIRLKGMMSGREFVREIPIELPDRETQHDVLGTLWARNRVDDLMGGDMSGVQAGNMRQELKTEITNLGLAHRLMTQFTSFVAVDEQSPADGIAPQRVDVPVESTSGEVARVNNAGPLGLSTLTPGINASFSGVSATVTVQAGTPLVQSDSADVGVTITQRSLAELPINGRSLSSLYLMSPGTVAAGANDVYGNISFSGSTNGQRASSNQFTIDGVNANFGVAAGGAAPGASAGGSAPALTAVGDTSAIAPFGSVQEVEIHTSGAAAEYGRNTGAVVNVVTKSGTNAFHGSAFEIFGNHSLDANDWFANNRGLSRPQSGSNEFGGNFGGPIKRDRLFFFAAYEGLRLRQPVTSITDAPSLQSRLAAPVAIRRLFSAYPFPTGPARPDGFAESAAAFLNRGRDDSGALRFDFTPTNKLTLGGHYNFSDSTAEERGMGGFSLNTLARNFNRSDMVSGRAALTISPRIAADIRMNYGRLSSRSSYRLDDFGGAILPPASLLAQNNSLGSFVVDLNSRSTMLMFAPDATSTQRQFNAVGSIAMVSGEHSMKFGADYRRTFPIIGLRKFEQNALFDGVTQALTGVAARVNLFTRSQPQRPVFENFSAYAQDEWRKTSRLTFNYGLRWELNPAPARNNLLAVTDVTDTSRPTFGSTSTRLWSTTYGNFSPRLGVLYKLNRDGSFVVRAGVGVFYDTSNSAVGDALAESYPAVNALTAFDVPFSLAPSLLPASATVTAPLSVFDPRLRLPYSLQWNASIEREVGSDQVISASYIASANRRLLLTSTLVDPSAPFSLVRLTNNEGRSDYRSLQLQFRRRFSKGFGATASYTWGNSTDNFSDDSAAHALFRAFDSRLERGPSDFDVRHTLTGFVSYDPRDLFSSGIGKRLFHNWSINSVFNVHTAQPINVVYAVPTTYGLLYLRPDVIPGAILFTADASVANGRRVNADAFIIPTDLRQGDLERNALRGFPLAQFDLGLRRRFNLTEDLRLTLGLEAANIFNHPNFASPDGYDASLGTLFSPSSFTLNPTFGQSFTHAARIGSRAPGDSFSSSYYSGGARTLRFSARLEF
jgi:Ca-activated chloride channel family protein